MALLAPVAWIALGMTVPLTGTVEDSAGRPVAGATVWLGDTGATRKGPQVLASGETDARGHFRLERADDLAAQARNWPPMLWAFKPGSHVALVEFKANLPAADEPVRLILGPPASTPLRVVRPDGSPSAGTAVHLCMTSLKIPLPPDGMLDRLATTTDADGRTTIDGLAPDDIFALDVTAPGQIVQCLPIDAGKVTLHPIGRLKARIVAADPKAARGWTIKARSIVYDQAGPRRTLQRTTSSWRGHGRRRPSRAAAARCRPRRLGDQAARRLELPPDEGAGDDDPRRRDGGGRNPHSQGRAGRGGRARRARRGSDPGCEARPPPAQLRRLAELPMARHRRPGALLKPGQPGSDPLQLLDPRRHPGLFHHFHASIGVDFEVKEGEGRHEFCRKP